MKIREQSGRTQRREYLMEYRIYCGTEQSSVPGHNTNEDHYMFTEYRFMKDGDIKTLVVADGMGGLEDGDKASANALEGFLEKLYAEISGIYMKHAAEEGYSVRYTADEVANAMKRAVQAANKKVCREAGMLKETGSTISAVCVFDDCAVTVNVGDSPIYFYRQSKDTLKLVSTLQTVAEQDVRAGRYERYSDKYYQNDHRLYQSLGQFHVLGEEDICSSFIGQLQPGDMIIVGSDGAFGRMKENELRMLVRACPEEEETLILPCMFERAQMDKEDDRTAILYVVAGEEG